MSKRIAVKMLLVFIAMLLWLIGGTQAGRNLFLYIVLLVMGLIITVAVFSISDK
ncbi:MAG: hypothetical protein PHT40_01110 [Patescibacteria group bacterium]|nr:hypothetical protein [Patescibacteria group bacterium]